MEFFESSMFFGSSLTLVVYFLCIYLKDKLKWQILNPILLSMIVIIALLLAFDIDYQSYNSTASYVSYFITPATICLALPLYRQIEVLKKNFGAIIIGVVSGVMASGFSIYLISIAFGLTSGQYATILPKSITTAIGLPLAVELGGIGDITVAAIIVTGMFGNLTGEFFLKWARVKSPVAKGIALGCASHVIGTVKAMELGEVEGAMSSLSIAISGLVTVVAAQFFMGLV